MKPKPPSPRESGRVSPVVPLLIVILAAAGFFVWRNILARSAGPAGVVALSGRIEGDDSAVSGKQTGRLLTVTVREGDQVKAGDLIATLDEEQVRAREQQAEAALTGSEARLKAAQQQIAVLNEQLQQTAVETGQARQDAQGRVSQAEAELAAVEAELVRQQSALKLAAFDRDAYARLAQTGAASERQAKQTLTTADTQEALVSADQRRVESARAALSAAQAMLRNPEIRTLQGQVLRQQIAQQQSQIATAVADAQRAKAQLAEAQANRQDLRITAPFDGTVITRTAEPGEVLAAGTPVITLLDLHKIYLRGYIPEGQIGHVKIGQAARVYLDSNPNRPVEAYVLRVDPQATFTPENTYFRDDRVKQVVGVKLGLKAGFGNAKPGMPADGEILIGGDTWPQGTRRQ